MDVLKTLLMEQLMKPLTDTQKKILTAAAKEPKLPIEEHMAHYKSPAVRRQIAYSLLCNGYVTEDGDCHYITDEGVAALGGKKPKAKAAAPKPEKAVSKAKPGQPSKGRQLLIDMMSRKEGATTEQMIEATSWQRGAIGGTLSKIKKQLKPLKQEVTSTKGEDGKLVYKIAAA